MSDKYLVEVLLRPPVEFYPAVTASCAAGLLIVAPSLLMMTPSVAYATSGLLGWLALHRARQGMLVLRYQRGLVRASHYELRAKKIPVSQQQLFLGRGFRWRQLHTERLHAVRQPEAQTYLAGSVVKQWIRRKERQWEAQPLLQPIARMTASQSPFNLLRPLPPIGGEPALHGVGLAEEENVFMPLSERVGHTLVVGKTRVGKTRLAEVLITQDIQRGNVTIVLDPKGDADLLKRVYLEAKRARKLNALYIFHLGHPEMSCRYNAIGSFSRITEVASRIANQLPGEGNATAFREFAWQFINVIAVALIGLSERPTYDKIRRYLRNIDPLFLQYARHWLSVNGPANWQDEVASLRNQLNPKTMANSSQKGRDLDAVAMMQYITAFGIEDTVLEGLVYVFGFEKAYYDKLTVAAGPFLEKLSTGKIAQLVTPDYEDLEDQRTLLDWSEVIRREGIVYVGLDALTDPEVARAVGESMFSDLTSLAGRIYKHGVEQGLPNLGGKKHPAITIHGDEFSDLIGPKFKTLINKSGGAGYELVLYTQSWSDVTAELGSEAKAGQIAGNLGTIIMLRVQERATAEMLTKQLPEVDVKTLMAVSAVTDAGSLGEEAHFTSRNEDRISSIRVPLLTSADIVSLPIGQAFCLLNGSHLHKIRIPLASKKDDELLPNELTQMLTTMQEHYPPSYDWQSWHQTRRE